jgi:hypothetical protein
VRNQAHATATRRSTSTWHPVARASVIGRRCPRRGVFKNIGKTSPKRNVRSARQRIARPAAGREHAFARRRAADWARTGSVKRSRSTARQISSVFATRSAPSNAVRGAGLWHSRVCVLRLSSAHFPRPRAGQGHRWRLPAGVKPAAFTAERPRRCRLATATCPRNPLY